MSKPAILLFPGSFVRPVLGYQPIIDHLTREGYEIKGLHPPSVGPGPRQGRDGPAPTMYDDAALIATEAEKLADEGKDVIVIGHSYGGVPVSQAPKDLSKDQRQAQGKPGGIVRLGYITSLVPALGKSAVDVLGTVPKEDQVNIVPDESGWMVHEQPADTARICLNNLSPEAGTAIVEQFSKHSFPSFTSELTHAGYKDIPVSYLFCEEDLCIPPAVQQAGIDEIERVSGRKVDVTSITADHCPNWTAKQKVVEWILDIAGKAQ